MNPDSLQQHQQHSPSQEKKPSLEAVMEQLVTTMNIFMENTETKIENQEALIINQASSLHSLEVQVGQIASLLFARIQGSYQATPTKFQKSKYMRLP